MKNIPVDLRASIRNAFGLLARRSIGALGLLIVGGAAMAQTPATPTTTAATAASAPLAATTAAPISAERIAEIVASPDRSEADRKNDVRRKPAELLAFIGLRPGMTVLDVSAGGGYTTELLARAVGPSGRVYGQSRPRDPAPARPASTEGAGAPMAPMASMAPTASASAGASPPSATVPRPSPVAERAKKPTVANLVAVVQPFEQPAPPEVASGALDLVTLMFDYHDLGYMGVDRAQMNAAIFRALKPGGMYVIADHAGRPGTGISEANTLHRVEEAFLRSEVEAAGFRLAASGDFLRNPADPRTMNTMNPPQPNDEFVLKFVKP